MMEVTNLRMIFLSSNGFGMLVDLELDVSLTKRSKSCYNCSRISMAIDDICGIYCSSILVVVLNNLFAKFDYVVIRSYIKYNVQMEL